MTMGRLLSQSLSLISFDDVRYMLILWYMTLQPIYSPYTAHICGLGKCFASSRIQLFYQRGMIMNEVFVAGPNSEDELDNVREDVVPRLYVEI